MTYLVPYISNRDTFGIQPIAALLSDTIHAAGFIYLFIFIYLLIFFVS